MFLIVVYVYENGGIAVQCDESLDAALALDDGSVPHVFHAEGEYIPSDVVFGRVSVVNGDIAINGITATEVSV